MVQTSFIVILCRKYTHVRLRADGIDLFILLTSCNWSNSAFFKMAFKDVIPKIC